MLRLHLYLNVSAAECKPRELHRYFRGPLVTNLKGKKLKPRESSKDMRCFLRQPLKGPGSSGCRGYYRMAEEALGHLPFSVHLCRMLVFWDVWSF